MKIERTRNTIRNISWGYLYRSISIILPFCFRTVMIKILGADYLGINSLFASILQVLSLSELGFGSAMVFSMYKPIAENDKNKICALLNFYKKIYLIIGSIILGLGLIIGLIIPYLISGNYPSDINIYFVYIMFLLNTSISYFLCAYRGSLINAFQRNDVESKILIIVSVIRYGFEIAGICITRQYYIYLVVELGSTLLQNFLKLIITRKMYPQIVPKGNIDLNEKKEIKDNVLALMCHKIGGIMLNSTDNIVISAFMGVVIVSNYGNYYYIMNAIEGIVIVCFTSMTAGIGNSFVTESIEKNKNNFKKVLFFNGWIVGFFCVCFICIYQNFIEFWVGKQYMFGYDVVILLVIYFFVHCIRRTIISFRDGAGMWQDNKWQPIVSAIFNIIANVILINVIGIDGILLSSIAAMVLIDIPWETKAFCRRIGMKPQVYYGILFKYFLLTVWVSGITYVITMNFYFNSIINLIIKSGICLIVPNFLFWLTLRRKTEFVYFKELIRKMI